ncbi:MAG: Hsp20/alpha crystallin family protein [Deltaproteobacteria bacterium]|nr:Hsp20/alpha crystallin family protein [Deltaproteobacteria bacterium]
MNIHKHRNRNMPVTQRARGSWNPLREISLLQKNLDRMFDDFWSPVPDLFEPLDEVNAFMPPVDVQDTENAYLLSFDLPGVSKHDLKIEMRDSQLVISGERKEEVERREKGGHLASERVYGTFLRSFTLPSNVDASKIEASFRDGVLHIAVPKTEATKSKPIEIKETGKGGIIDRLLGNETKKEEKAA